MARRKREDSRPRASWRGMLRFGLVSFGVQAFNARVREEGEVSFHQLHQECHSRIRHEKVCPLHGQVPQDDIVSGYEYSKGRYVEVDPEELDALRSDAEKSLTIDSFIAPDDIDPIYFDGRMYYLTPDGAEAGEPYQIFVKGLESQERYGVGQVVFSGKEQVVLVRPYEGALHMALLNYSAEIRPPASVLAELPPVKDVTKKLRLAEQLIEAWSDDDFDFGQYHDRYLEKLRDLIEAKVEGRELVTPPAEDTPEVINLMDALRKSVAQASSRKMPGRGRAPAARSVSRRKPKRRAS